MAFCDKSNINTKYCKCRKCKQAVVKKGAKDLATLERQLPALMERADHIRITANVYMNYESNGRTGMEMFLNDLAGLPLPEFSKNQAEAKYDEKSNLVSPYYAWQATIYLAADDPAIKEIEEVYGPDKVKPQGSGVVVHSNALAKAILSMKTTELPVQSVSQTA